MIASLCGRLLHADSESVIVDVGGVGYLVRAVSSVISSAQKDPANVSIFVHTNVREDAIQLFGFSTLTEKVLFEKLTTLQGVGPKVAMSILSTISARDLHRATLMEDVALLQSVPGIGPKVARRIVTELKDKLEFVLAQPMGGLRAQVSDVTNPQLATFYEAREALVGLGLSIQEADHALANTDEKAPTDVRVKQALASRKVGL